MISTTLNTIIILAVGSIITLLSQYIKTLLDKKIETKQAKLDTEINTFEKLIFNHSQVFKSFNINGKFPSDEILSNHLDMIHKFVLWSNDEVLVEFSKYWESIDNAVRSKLNDSDIQFGRSILAFRRYQLKNKSKNVTPEQIAIIYKAGWDKRA